MSSPVHARRRALRCVALLAGLSNLFAARRVLAEPAAPSIDLTWEAPEGCPSRAAVLERVERATGPRIDVAEHIGAVARVSRQGGTFVLEITVRAGDLVQERTARSRTCEALGRAAAIILATALDEAGGVPAPPAATELVESRPEGEAPRTQARAGERAGRDQPASSPPVEGPRARREHRVPIGLGVAALFDFGTLPRPTAGVAASAHMRLEQWLFAVEGTLWSVREQSFAERTLGGARFESYTVGAHGCRAWYDARVGVGPCAGLEITHLKLEGIAIRQPVVTRVIWPTARIGVLAEARLSRTVGMFFRVDAAFALGVPPFVLTTSRGDVTLHEVSVPAVRVIVGARADIL